MIARFHNIDYCGHSMRCNKKPLRKHFWLWRRNLSFTLPTTPSQHWWNVGALFWRLAKIWVPPTYIFFYTPTPHISRIHILQKISLRLIINVPNLTHSAPLFKECQIMPIQDYVKIRTVTMVYKTLHSLTPTYMRELITYQSEMSTRNIMYSRANKL